MTTSFMKRAVIFAWNRGWISLLTTQRLFDRFSLGRF
jgi:hypothetical protein